MQIRYCLLKRRLLSQNSKQSKRYVIPWTDFWGNSWPVCIPRIPSCWTWFSCHYARAVENGLASGCWSWLWPRETWSSWGVWFQALHNFLERSMNALKVSSLSEAAICMVIFVIFVIFIIFMVEFVIFFSFFNDNFVIFLSFFYFCWVDSLPNSTLQS